MEDIDPRFAEATYQARVRREALEARVRGLLAPHLAEEVLADVADYVDASRKALAVMADVMNRARRA